jgi:hypothetical protein
MAQREIMLLKADIIASLIFFRVIKEKCIKLIRVPEKDRSAIVRVEINEGQ